MAAYAISGWGGGSLLIAMASLVPSSFGLGLDPFPAGATLIGTMGGSLCGALISGRQWKWGMVILIPALWVTFTLIYFPFRDGFSAEVKRFLVLTDISLSIAVAVGVWLGWKLALQIANAMRTTQRAGKRVVPHGVRD